MEIRLKNNTFSLSSYFTIHSTPLAFWWIGLPSPWRGAGGEAFSFNLSWEQIELTVHIRVEHELVENDVFVECFHHHLMFTS